MQSFPKNELIRIVMTDSGLSLDSGGKLPGRGAYLCRNRACLDAAIKKNAIGRNLKISITREECEQLIPQFEELTSK